jgi:hypothetical protein
VSEVAQTRAHAGIRETSGVPGATIAGNGQLDQRLGRYCDRRLAGTAQAAQHNRPVHGGCEYQAQPTRRPHDPIGKIIMIIRTMSWLLGVKVAHRRSLPLLWDWLWIGEVGARGDTLRVAGGEHGPKPDACMPRVIKWRSRQPTRRQQARPCRQWLSDCASWAFTALAHIARAHRQAVSKPRQ